MVDFELFGFRIDIHLVISYVYGPACQRAFVILLFRFRFCSAFHEPYVDIAAFPITTQIDVYGSWETELFTIKPSEYCHVGYSTTQLPYIRCGYPTIACLNAWHNSLSPR